MHNSIRNKCCKHKTSCINLSIFLIIVGGEKEYLSLDMIYKSNAADSQTWKALTPKFLNSLGTSGLPNHKIELKVGSLIMLLRNIDQSEGLCNGTRLIVTRSANHVIQQKIIDGNKYRNQIYIPRILCLHHSHHNLLN